MKKKNEKHSMSYDDQHKFYRLAPRLEDGLLFVSIQKNIIIFYALFGTNTKLFSLWVFCSCACVVCFCFIEVEMYNRTDDNVFKA